MYTFEQLSMYKGEQSNDSRKKKEETLKSLENLEP